MLTIAMLTPRPMLKTVTATTSLGKIGQATMNQIALAQYSATRLLAVLTGGLGAYEIYNAKSIARDLNREGINTTPAQIRLRGFLALGRAFLATSINRTYVKRGASSPGFEKQISKTYLKKLEYTSKN